MLGRPVKPGTKKNDAAAVFFLPYTYMHAKENLAMAGSPCSPRGHARRRRGVDGDADSLGMLRTAAVLVEELRNSGSVEDGHGGTRWQ